MKTIQALLLLLCSTYVSAQTPNPPPPAKPQQAEMVRTANGRFVSPDGFTEGDVKLVKGMIFDVDRLDIRGVIVHHAQRKVMIDKQNVRLFDRLPSMQATARGFTPGQLIILSARYSLEGNQPRNVKTRLEKYLPDKGLLTAPLKFLVTDDLSSAAGNQQFIIIEGQATQVVIVPDQNGQKRVVVRQGTPSTVIQTAPNVLAVEYSFAGKKYRKVGYEGTEMVLP